MYFLFIKELFVFKKSILILRISQLKGQDFNQRENETYSICIVSYNHNIIHIFYHLNQNNNNNNNSNNNNGLIFL